MTSRAYAEQHEQAGESRGGMMLVGVLLIVVAWFESWLKFTPLYALTFFPLWLGYVVFINGFSYWLLGTSLWGTLGRRFVLLFAISIPFWWLFEFLNVFVQNWEYVTVRPIGYVNYAVRASIAFSTVIPAVLSTQFLAVTIAHRLRQSGQRKTFVIPPVSDRMLLIVGAVCLLAIVSVPRIAFPLVWIGPLLIFEGLNGLAGARSLMDKLRQGEWRDVLLMALAPLVTGFCWELWNYYALPKWIYTIPYFGGYKVFEMPILGYLGYPFFGLLLYSFTQLVAALLRRFRPALPQLPF